MHRLPAAFVTLVAPGTLALVTWPFLWGLRAPAEAGEGAGTPLLSAERPSTDPFVRWLDVDRDGRDDLFVLHSAGRAELYRDHGSGAFAVASAEFGLDELPALRSARWLDVDSDGAPDLFAVGADGRSRLYRNVGGMLEERSSLAGLAIEGLEATAWTDFDGDGDPDLVSLSAAGAELRVNDGSGVFSSALLEPRLGTPVAGPSFTPARTQGVQGLEEEQGEKRTPRESSPRVAGAPEISAGASGPVLERTFRKAVDPAPGAGVPVSSPPFEVVEELSAAGLGTCVASIADVASGPCLPASSTPFLGALYPQTLHLNVDASNDRVGVGTVLPRAKLDVVAARSEGGVRSHTGGDFAAGTFLTDSGSALALDVRSQSLAAAFQGDVYFGREGLGALMIHAILNTDVNDASQFIMNSATALPMIEMRAVASAGDGAEIKLRNAGGLDTLRLDANSSKNGAVISMEQPTGTKTLELMASDDQTDGAEMSMWADDGKRTVHLVSQEGERNGAQLALGLDDGTQSIILDAQLGDDAGAQLVMRDKQGNTTVDLRADESLGTGARLHLKTPEGVNTMILDADTTSGSVFALRNEQNVQTFDVLAEESTGNGSVMSMRTSGGVTSVVIDAETTYAGEMSMRTDSGQETIELLAQEGSTNGAQLTLRAYDGTTTIVMDAQTSNAAVLSMRDKLGQETVQIVAEETAGTGGQIVLRKADGTASIVLDAEQGATGRITTEILEITGGSDLVEGFDTGAVECEPGSVVVIDDERVGELTLSARPYDARVAGVVSGAGGIRPGLRMGQAGVADGDTPVALSGRVFVRCNTENGPVRPGDLLTTSSTLGEAMRATDPEHSYGAVIGKAMGPLAEGSGLVLVLVSLQ